MGRFKPNPAQLDEVLRLLKDKIEDGIRHGFFEFAISCEAVRDERRKLTVRAGKNYRFVVEAQNESYLPTEEPGK